MRDELDLRLKKAELDSAIVKVSLQHNFNRPTDENILRSMLGNSAQSWVLSQIIPNNEGVRAWDIKEFTSRLEQAELGKDTQKLLKERLEIMQWINEDSPSLENLPIFNELSKEHLPFNQESTSQPVVKAVQDSPYMRLAPKPVEKPALIVSAPIIETVPATGSIPAVAPVVAPPAQAVPRRLATTVSQREVVDSRQLVSTGAPTNAPVYNEAPLEYTNEYVEQNREESEKEPSSWKKMLNLGKEYFIGVDPID